MTVMNVRISSTASQNWIYLSTQSWLVHAPSSGFFLRTLTHLVANVAYVFLHSFSVLFDVWVVRELRDLKSMCWKEGLKGTILRRFFFRPVRS